MFEVPPTPELSITGRIRTQLSITCPATQPLAPTTVALTEATLPFVRGIGVPSSGLELYTTGGLYVAFWRATSAALPLMPLKELELMLQGVTPLGPWTSHVGPYWVCPFPFL